MGALCTAVLYGQKGPINILFNGMILCRPSALKSTLDELDVYWRDACFPFKGRDERSFVAACDSTQALILDLPDIVNKAFRQRFIIGLRALDLRQYRWPDHRHVKKP